MSTPANPLPSQPSPSGGTGNSIFSKIGGFLRQNSGTIADIGNRLAAAGGNYAPLEIAHQAKEDALKQSQFGLQQQLNQSQLENQALNRKVLQQQYDNYQTPTQQAQHAVDIKHAETPSTYQTDSGQTGIADTDLTGKTSPRMVTIPSAQVPNPTQAAGAGMPPQTMPPLIPPSPTVTSAEHKTPAIMPQSVGFHITDPVTGTVYEYGKGGAAMGTQPGPPNPNAPIVPGMGKVNPIDAGAAGALPPSPRDYPKGANDPAFRAAYGKYLTAAAAAKQANAMQQSNARGAAMGSNRPINALDDDGQAIVTTLARQDRKNPGQDVLSASQSGAAGIAQRKATFAEVDKNLANTKAALPVVDNLSIGDRAAIVAGLTPGKSAIGQGITGIGLAHLSPEARSLVDTTRNLRQGVLSLRNVLSSGGAGSDYRINILESEMPNEQDFAASSSKQIAAKLQSFESIYNDIVSSYPQLFTQPRSKLNAKPGATPTPAAPPTMPATSSPAPGGKWNPVKGVYE